MTELSTHSKFDHHNVSRRGLLKGVAATGGLVLAAQFPAVRGALAAYPTGADRHAERRGQQPQGVRLASAATARSASSPPAPRWATAPPARRCR